MGKLGLAQRLARAELYRRGELWPLLDDCKLDIYRDIQKAPPRAQYVLEACRKLGKSYLFCLIAIETALRNPGQRINYACPTGKMALEIVVPIMSELQRGAPSEYLGTFSSQTGHITWPNAAYVVLFGGEDEVKADRGRGPQAILSIVDEAGFIPVLSYVLNSVIRPQHLRTGGLTLIGSTPPKSPGHDFCDVADAAERAGTYAHRDIYSPGIEGIPEPETFVAAEAQARGLSPEDFKATTDFQREYLALRVTDAESAVVPEWAAAAEACTQEHPRPPYFTPCTVLDLGFVRDLTGGVFGYYDFAAGLLVVEGEVALRQAGTGAIGDAIAATEAELWPGTKVGYRYLDDPGRMSADLYDSHQLVCSPVLNKNPDADRGQARLLVGGKRVRIHPRCKVLLRQLRNAVFGANGKDWERTALDGHMDVLAAFVYFCRLAPTHNPYPADYDLRQAGPNAQRVDTSWHQQQGTPIQQALMGGSATGRLLMRRRR